MKTVIDFQKSMARNKRYAFRKSRRKKTIAVHLMKNDYFDLAIHAYVHTHTQTHSACAYGTTGTLRNSEDLLNKLKLLFDGLILST